jgi:hypothetical protein
LFTNMTPFGSLGSVRFCTERHGLELGIVVEPAEIPDRYTLLLAARTLSGPDARMRLYSW